MSSRAPLAVEELPSEVRALLAEVESLGHLFADALLLLAPGHPALAEAVAQAAGIDPPGWEDPERAAQVPEHVLSAVRRAYQSCAAPLRLSSELVERLGRVAARWNRTRPETMAHVDWEDMARLAISGFLALSEASESREHSAGG